MDRTKIMKDAVVMVRMEPSLKAKAARKAKAQGLTLSEWIRFLLASRV